MRPIDADALKLLLREYCIDGDEVVAKWYDIMGIDEVIDRAPTIDAAPRWIPCEERLPEEYNPYLVCEEDGECIVHWLEDADWARRMIKNDGIVAWMPLPEPYEGERKDDE